jgi:hypothetical protein
VELSGRWSIRHAEGIDGRKSLFHKPIARISLRGNIMSIFVAFLLASSAAAPDQSAVPAPTAAPAPAKPAKEKRICKTEDPDPGSHMVRRTCKSQEEWNQQGVLGTSRSGFSISGDKMQDGSH